MEAKRQDIGMDIDENKKEETQKSTSAVREILSWVLTFALAIGAAFLIKNYLIINADVPTGSMENTIMPGARLIGNRQIACRGHLTLMQYESGPASGSCEDRRC